MEEKNKNKSVYQSISSALRASGRKAETPNISSPSYQSGLLSNQENTIEGVQQNFLDWQVDRISRDLYQRTVYAGSDRLSAYQDFRAMDNSPTVSAALSIIRDECLTRSETGKILEVYSDDSRIKEALTDLFKNVLNIDYNLRLWIRELIKYGDYFVYLQTDNEVGVYNFMVLPNEEVHREEGINGKIGDVRFRWDTTNQYFEDWQIAHFRLIEDTKKLPYGRSILDSARKVWKQLQLAMDAMLVYRIERAPERRVFHIDVGNLPPEDIPQYMQKVQNQIKKQPVVNPRTGDWNFKYNPLNVTEDFFIPIRGDKSSKIETLPGAQNLDQVQDINFLQSQLFAALQVPKAYLNFVDSLPGGSTLSQADLRFSRTINTIQEAVLLELRRIANVHLYLLGFHDDLDNFTLSLTNPSTQQELLKLETLKSRMEVWEKMVTQEANSPCSYTWGMENLLGFSKKEIKHMLKQKKVEKKLFAEIDAAVDTYKKTGLFKDIDDKYETDAPVEGGQSSTSSSEPEDTMSQGSFDEPAQEPQPEEPAAPEQPLAERRKKRRVIRESVDDLIDELLEEDFTSAFFEVDETKPASEQVETNNLIRNNNKFNSNTQKLIKSIEEKLGGKNGGK